MTKGDNFRKRAEHLRKRLGNRAHTTSPLGKKQKALTDMAANEDWLDGIVPPKPNGAAK